MNFNWNIKFLIQPKILVIYSFSNHLILCDNNLLLAIPIRSIISISSQKIFFLINHWDYDINIVYKCNKNMPLFNGFFFVPSFFSNLIREKKMMYWLEYRKNEIDHLRLLINNQYNKVGGTYGFIQCGNSWNLINKFYFSDFKRYIKLLSIS